MRRRDSLAAVALLAVLTACGGGRPVNVAGPDLADVLPTVTPAIQQAEFGGGSSTTTLGGESLADVKEATPEGLHITTVQISVLSKAARDALHFTGFRSSRGPGLLTLPIYGVNPDLGMYYLIVPVVNEGPAPVRNLKARADFYDANGVIVWSETQALTYFPTRLGLNPPSLPNDRNANSPQGELGQQTHGFNLYYFAGNVGIFTFAVPDTAVAKTVKTWDLTFLVSTT
ncbi:MAG: hypothetical protein ABR548_10430 [Actinomycetota bacterium]